MTPEEELYYLRGKVESLSQICSFLIATHVIGDNFTNMFKNRVSKVTDQAGESPAEQMFVKGYASLVEDIELARKTVREAGLLASVNQDKEH